MHSDKKITKEDTWKPSELRKHIRDEGYAEDRVRRREENERKHGSGETVERRPRDPDRGDRDRGDRDRDRDRHREKDHTRDKDKQKENNPYLDTRARDKGKGGEHNPYLDRRKEGSRDRRAEWEERDKEKRRDRERVADPAKHGDERGEHRDRRHNREEKDIQDRERDRQKEKERRRERERDNDHGKNNREEKENQDRERDRQREKERRRERERDNDHGRNNRDEKGNEDRERDGQKDNERRREKERDDDHRRDRDRDKRREVRDRERRREERDREHGRERDRKRHEEGEETGRDGERRRDREQRDRERENLNEGEPQKHESRDRERRERHADRRHSENKEEQVYKEDGQKEREDIERRHKEREHHDEKRKHDGESREQRDGHHRGDRDRRDRDKHRERRHREEADPGPTYADETSTPKPHQGPRDKTTSSKIKEVVILPEPQTTIPTDLEEMEDPVGKDEELVEGQDYGDQEYEEDFEDYEEDFEEVEESGGEGEDDEEPPNSPVASGEGEEPPPQTSEEIKAIRRAMDEENERVGTAQSRQSSYTDQDRPTRSRDTEANDKNQSRGSQRGKFINFVAAKQREVSKQVANKQKKRSAELLRLIDLDFSTTVSLLDLPPVSEYDMYIKSFGNTNTKQAYVQCNEDNVDRDIQTEDIEMSEKWTQHPAERHGPCGDPRLSQDARDKSTSEMNIDTQRLTTFLRSASQVMVVLLEEDYAEKQSLKRLSTKAEVLSFSDGSLQFNTKLSFLNGRHVSLVHFSPVQKQTMMSVHSPTGKPDAVCLDTWTMICIWNIWEPSRPQKILVYESEVRCCCFSPGKATLVFAGTSVGSVLLWDLREHAGDHYNLRVGEDEWTFRHPTFSTDAVLAAAGHLSSVCCVEVVPSSGAGGLRPEAPLLASDEESSGLSFQLASLDVNGVLNQWVVVELPKASDAGSQTDLGLRPGGKVKLLHSSTLLAAAERTSPWDAVNTGSFQTLLLRFLPTDSNHFFIGTNMGVVNHGTSHGLKAPPKLYRSLVAGVRPTDVTSIHFSPFSPAVFLVGCGDGSIRLHAASQEEPVLEWNNATASEPVVSVQWTRTRPTVFCVLDAASNLYIWDLQKNDLEPAVTERIHADRVTAMAVFGDSGQQNTYSGVALAHESGKLEVQYFNERFTIPSAAEPETLESMINDAF